MYPHSNKEIELAKENIWRIANQLQLPEITGYVLLKEQFGICSGSCHPLNHHYGDGGLCIHTNEVINLCLQNNLNHKINLCEKEIFLAALFHDFGKIWDYKRLPDGTWTHNEHKNKIHHISKSYLEFNIAAAKYNFNCPHNIKNISHAILAHHDKYGGTGIVPQTKLAWLLHLCDSISGRMNSCQE